MESDNMNTKGQSSDIVYKFLIYYIEEQYVTALLPSPVPQATRILKNVTHEIWVQDKAEYFEKQTFLHCCAIYFTYIYELHATEDFPLKYWQDQIMAAWQNVSLPDHWSFKATVRCF
jgi:hypothetical protein